MIEAKIQFISITNGIYIPQKKTEENAFMSHITGFHVYFMKEDAEVLTAM